jgi:hypothetical protein
MASEEPARYGRAAVRWHGRFELEAKGLELVESQLALSALSALPADNDGIAMETLVRIGRLRGVSGSNAFPKLLASRFGTS